MRTQTRAQHRRPRRELSSSRVIHIALAHKLILCTLYTCDNYLQATLYQTPPTPTPPLDIHSQPVEQIQGTKPKQGC